jgi:flagellar basal body-associated protein FliL
MADKDDTKKQDSKEQEKMEKSEKKSLIKRIFPILIIIIVVCLCAGAGFGLGRFLGPEQSEPSETDSGIGESENTENTRADIDAEDDSKDIWYYDLEPVVANLNEPSVARYVSITITLQIGSGLSERDGRALIDKKIPILTDWLTVYLAGRSLEDIRGDKNLKSIQSQILDAFNEELFPDSKPIIKQILFRNFAVQ